MRRGPRRRGIARRAVALGLSWVFTATTVWASAPPPVEYPEPAPDPVASIADQEPPPEAEETTTAAPPPAAPIPCELGVFGPKRYTRTTGAPNVFTEAVAVPAWVVSPYALKVVNGEPDGSYRVSSARIEVNGTVVARPSDFNPNVPGLERSVTLTPQTTLVVTLDSAPASYLTINLCGQQGDKTPPQLAWTEPGPFVATATPRLAVQYEDAPGPADPLASGVDTATLAVTLDGTDRTALFTKRPSDASADVPADLALAEGLHALKATIRDLAGNAASAETSFTVDARAPELFVDSPKNGDYLKATPAEVRGRVVDADLETAVECRAGAETAPGTRSGPGPEVAFACALPLAEGPNTIEVVARDRLGHETTVTVPVTLDTTAPQVAIDTPQDGSWVQSETVDVTGHVEDASPVRTVTVNGVGATLTGSTFKALQVAVGTGRVTAHAEDAAGNAGEASIELRMDHNPPTVAITSPPENAWVRGPQVEVGGSVDDPERSPVVVEVNGQVEIDPQPNVPRSFKAVVDAGEGPLDLVATARDGAGNATSTHAWRVNVDFTAPVITLSEPVGTPITKDAKLRVAGAVADRSPSTLTIGGTAVLVGPDGSFSTEVPLPGEGEQTIALVATDSVGLAGTLDLRVIVDRTAPEVQIVSPAEGGFVVALPVMVEGTVDDEPAGLDVPPPTVTVDGQPATVTGQAWTITFEALPDGPHTFTAQARDAAGNESTPATRHVVLDLLPPTVAITDPAAPLLTRLDAITVRGTVESRTAATVTVAGVAATVSGTTWEARVPLAEGDNTIVAVARSASGRESEPKSVLVTRDSIAPTVDLQTPETIGRDEPGRGRADAADNLPGVLVEVRIDGVPVGAASPPPYEFDIAAPPQAPSGATLEVTAVATDRAGNVSSPLSRAVRIAAEGVVVGQVLSDATGLPVPDATVVLEAPSGQRTALSDAHGGYSFPTGNAVARVRASRDGMIPVERAVVVEPGVGTVVLDTRLTPLAEPVAVTPDGLVLPKVELPGPIPVELVLSVASGAVAQETQLRLTPLSAQGLPGLLPLGWSPLAAFDVRADVPVGAGLEARLTGLPEGGAHFVRFDTGSRAWTMLQPGLAPTSGALTIAVGGTGAFALVVPDPEPAPAVPAPGEVLPGVAQADLPATAVGQAAVEPSVVPPTGGTASGRLFVLSPTPLPSGTVVQAKVTEEFELASGQTASEEVRRQDILLFRAPLPTDTPATPAGETVLHAVLPVTAFRTFETAELRQGKVHLDVLAGRESVRGQTGGNRELTVQSGDAVLSVPAASLAEDTAVSLEESGLSPFLPTEADVEPLAEVVVDFAGAVLGTSAGLSVACIPGTCTCTGGCAGDTLLVARVERVLGIPRLLVVALAEANAGRIAAVATPGLAGIREGGRYVFYRLGGPVGWVSGPTTLASTGAPVAGAVVESDTLPFIARSGMDVPYRLVARPGTAQVKATVPGTRLAASATVAIAAGGPGQAVPLPLVFAGVATTATVTPANGTQGVAVSVQVEVEATAPLNASAENLANAKLFKGGEPMAVRYQLSLSGKRLAVIPVQPLATSTEYTFTAAGLKDAGNQDVLVPSPVVFRTKDFVPPVFNVDAIVFSYPEGGMTRVTAPAGSLPPFSEVLILNTTNGAVLWLQVDGDGCIGCIGGSNELPASIDDRLLVTITDPQGNVVTFERSKFVKADGTVAIGPGGGTVDGPGGVELRVPSGALEKGVELKAEGVSAEDLLQQFPGQLPDLGKDAQDKPVAHLASGLKLTSKDEPTFKKPIDLVFPLPDFTKAAEAERPPPDKPEDAYYYVVRRIEGPCADGSETCAPGERKVVFQTIDHAMVECPGGEASCEASEKKVVTASWPFGGYLDSYGVFSITPTGMLLQPVVATYAYLMWTYTQDLPGQALPGVITGKVLRAKWSSGTTVPEYEPVKDKLVVVSAVDDSGQRLFSGNEQITYASRDDGTFTLWDPRYTGGTVRVAATLTDVPGDPQTVCPATDGGDTSFRCGTAYESDPANWKTTGLRFHRNIATVNLTFPAVAPPLPPPAIGVTVYRTEGDKRVPTGGIVPSGTPVILAIQPSSTTVQVQEVLVQGVPESFRADPLKGQETGAEWIVEYVPATVGTYRVEVTGLQPKEEGPEAGQAEVVKGGTTFRVIGAGGTDEVVEGERPAVIDARTVPKEGATGAQVSTYVQVVFTEPVRNVSGNVTLRKVDETTTPPGFSPPIGVKLSGVLRGGGVVGDLDASPDAVITSLTVQPTSALEYGKKYRLGLTDGIEDLDTTGTVEPCAPSRCLVPYDTSFTTFTPEGLTENPESFGSPGIVILGERAYLVQNHFHSGTLRVFETTDPVSPQEIPNGPSDTRDPRYTVSYRPVDLVGESDSPLTGGRIVAVATGPTAQSKPSNVWLLDVADDSKTQWIGAVSLTKSAADGFINRTFLRAGVLYSATFRKGIQVVDLDLVKQAFKAPGSPEYFQMVQEFLTDNQGYGLGNVINIPVSSPFGGPARLNDIEASLMQTTDGALVLVGAAGDPGLTVVNPAAQSVLWNDKVTYERDQVVAATLRYGQALALGNVAGRDLAVIVGTGTIGQETQAKPLLMVVKLDDPSKPVGLGYVQLDDATVIDVILKDDLALLGGSSQVTLVSLTDPTNPTVLGTVQGIGGRLAIGENGSILFGTAHSVFGGTDVPLGGVRTAVLDTVAIIRQVSPLLVDVDEEGRSLEPVTVTYQIIGSPDDLTGGVIDFVRRVPGSDEATTAGSYPMQRIGNGTFSLEIPAGVSFEVPPAEVAIEVALPGGQSASMPPISINNPTEVAAANAAAMATGGEGLGLVVADFESLRPRQALRGSGELTVAVSGTNLQGLTSVFVRSSDGPWQALATLSATPISLSFRLPRTLLAVEGFLQVSPIPDAAASLAFQVAIPGLALPGTSLGILVHEADPSVIGLAGRVSVWGSGFREGMSVVLGRNGVPGVVLPTTFVDEVELHATLPPGFLGKANDLFVAVLSADRQALSQAVPLESAYPNTALDLSQWFEERGQEGDTPAAMVTNVSAELVWNTPNQVIAIEGLGLSAGLEILFRTGAQTFKSITRTADTSATRAADVPAGIGALGQWLADVPQALVRHSIHDFIARLFRWGAVPILSAPAPVVPHDALRIPLGGRGRFVAYGDTPLAPTKVVLVQVDGKNVRQIRPYGRDLKDRIHLLTGATFGITSNPIKPSGLTVVQRETGSDPDSLYLRGTGLTTGANLAQISVSQGTPSEAKGVAVVKKTLGYLPPDECRKQWTLHKACKVSNFPMRDNEILDVADTYGLPPQFLKAQAVRESGAYAHNFRYEPLTRDFGYMTGDDPTHILSPAKTPWIETEPLNLYAIGGRRLIAPTPHRRMVPLTPSDSPDGIHFAIEGPVMRRSGTPRPAVPAQRVEAVITRPGAPAQHLTLSLDYPTWRKGCKPHFLPGRVPNPACAPGKLTGAQSLGPDNFSIEYVTGQVRLGRALQEGETLTVSYDVVAGDTTQPIDPGSASFISFDLMTRDSNGKRIVQEGPDNSYHPGETVFDWFAKNLEGSEARQLGSWLTGTKSELELEFTVQPGTALPAAPLDPRYRGMTAQPFASSAYGALQVQLDHWANPGDRVALNTVLDAAAEPVFAVLTDFKRGLAVGAVLHQALYDRRAHTNPSQICNPCTEDEWKDQWFDLFRQWNRNGEGYNAGGEIQTNAERYEPR